MQNLLLLLFMLLCFYTTSQIDKYSVLGIPAAADDNEIAEVTDANKGSMVYNIAKENVYIFNGTKWVPVHKEHVYGDVKYGIQTDDHSGWYILDGRPLSELPKKAQGAAISLGLANLPNAKGRFLKAREGEEEVIFNAGGLNSVTLAKENLPNTTFIGTALEGGIHTHSGTTQNSGNHNHRYGTERVYGYYFPPADKQRKVVVYGEFHSSYSTSHSGIHKHNFNIDNSGPHAHEVLVNSGGADQALENRPSFLALNVFIYLGN
ncbi:MAG: hypothetical protein ACK5H1_07135 [Tenacibaculum sp.]